LSEEASVGLITDAIATVSNVLGGTLPTLFAILALLVGAFMVWRIVKKHVGRPK